MQDDVQLDRPLTELDSPQQVVDEEDVPFWSRVYEKINLARQAWAYLEQVRKHRASSDADTLPVVPGDTLRNYLDMNEHDPPPVKLLEELADDPKHRLLADLPELKLEGLPPVQLVDILYIDSEDEDRDQLPSPVLRAWNKHHLT